MTYNDINYDDCENHDNYNLDGICCVCLDITSGRSQQFYNCSNIGVHYICNCCYSEWRKHKSNNSCPACRSSAKN